MGLIAYNHPFLAKFMSHITTSLQLMLPLPISTISPRSMFQPFFRTFHSIFQDRHGETGRPLAQANHAHLDGGQNSWWRDFLPSSHLFESLQPLINKKNPSTGHESKLPHRKIDPPSPATTLWFKVKESSLMDDEDQEG